MSTTNRPAPRNAQEGGLHKFFNEGVVLLPLKDGKYTARFIPSATGSIGSPQMTDKGLEFIRFDLQLPDRRIVDNRFDQGFNIMLSQIQQQLKITEPIGVKDLLNKCRDKDITIYITNTTADDGKTYRNISYLEPIAAAAPATKETALPFSE